jgi:hypothetical protein
MNKNRIAIITVLMLKEQNVPKVGISSMISKKHKNIQLIKLTIINV